jgi:hypothetical protein
MYMRFTHERAAVAAACLALALAAAPAGAVTAGNVDTFQAGAEGWYVPAGTPLPPEVIDTGGPAGAGDAFLQLSSSGTGGAGGKLVVFGSNDWIGNYAAAGVTSIALDAKNLGTTNLQLRLYFKGPAGSALSTAGVNLAAGSGWTHLVFPLAPAALSGANPAATLANVTEFRLFHNESPAFPPSAVLGTLGIDNVTAVAAVPEPGTLALWAAGAAILPIVRRRSKTS